MNTPLKKDREEALTLEILNELSARSNVTQRHLADHLGVALGLANSYLKRCVRKGYVKIKQAPANRYLYYVTPKGFAEKSRLTAQYLAYSFDFYRTASQNISNICIDLSRNNIDTVLFAGVSELSEIGAVRMQDAGIELVGVYDPGSELAQFVGLPVWRDLAEVGPAETGIFMSLQPNPQLHADLLEHFGPNRVYVPEMLNALTIEPSSG